MRRLSMINLVAAVAFILGGSLFALGALFAQLEVGTLATVNITYLVGGFFFSLGGYASILLVVNAGRDERDRAHEEPMRWWGYQPHRRDWLSAAVLFTGTLLFAVSLVAAFAEGPHSPPVQRMDLVPGHPRLRLLPRVRPPRDARGGRRSRRGARP